MRAVWAVFFFKINNLKSTGLFTPTACVKHVTFRGISSEKRAACNARIWSERPLIYIGNPLTHAHNSREEHVASRNNELSTPGHRGDLPGEGHEVVVGLDRDHLGDNLLITTYESHVSKGIDITIIIYIKKSYTLNFSLLYNQ